MTAAASAGVSPPACQPVPKRAVRRMAAGEPPPIQIGRSGCTGRGETLAPFRVKWRPAKSTLSSRQSRVMISSASSVTRPRVAVSSPIACHSGAAGLPMPKAGSSRPSESTSMVAHCLATSTGSRKASETTFMPNFSRRVRPAKPPAWSCIRGLARG